MSRSIPVPNDAMLDIYKSTIGKQSAPVALSNAIKEASKTNKDDIDDVAVALGSLQAADAFIGVLKNLKIGPQLSLASLGNNLYNANKQLDSASGKISDSTKYAIVSDVASLLGVAAVAIAGTASAPVVLGIVATSTLISAGFGLAAFLSDEEPTDEMNDALNDLYQGVVDVGKELDVPPEELDNTANELIQQAEDLISEKRNEPVDYSGDDWLYGGDRPDTIYGDKGEDLLFGSRGIVRGNYAEAKSK